MSLRRSNTKPDGLDEVDAALRDLRPRLSDHRLNAMIRRARHGSAGEHIRRKDSSVRSRLAILAMLVLGFGLSGAGAGLAVSGVSGDAVSAQVGQYDETNPDEQTPSLQPEQDVKGEQDESDDTGTTPTDDVAGTETQPVQETRQLSTQAGDDSSLPFTGFAAIPVLLLGVALLVGGALLHRSTRSDTA